MSSAFNVDTSGNIINSGTITNSILNTAGIVHNNSLGVFSTSLIVAADIASATITGSKIAPNTITNSLLSTMPSNTIKGNNTGGVATPLDLTVTQVQALLGITGSVTIANTQVGFGNPSNNLIGSANLTWTDSTKVLSLASGSEINLGSSTTARGIVLFNGSSNAHQYYGINVNSGAQVYHVDQTLSSHIFRCGLTSTTSQDLFNIGGNKIVSTIAGGGLQLANSQFGYVPSTLDRYEQSTAITLTISGPWASRSLPVILTRVGNIVVMAWDNFAAVTATAAAVMTSNTVTGANSRFLPASGSYVANQPVYDGVSTVTDSQGLFIITGGPTSWSVSFSKANAATFAIGEHVGIPGGTQTWIADA